VVEEASQLRDARKQKKRERQKEKRERARERDIEGKRERERARVQDILQKNSPVDLLPPISSLLPPTCHQIMNLLID
jgi:hypothetical protein